MAHAKSARAGQPYVVSALSNGNLWRVEDINGDGDALDVGERTLWGGGFTFPMGMAAHNGALYAVETGLPSGSNQIVRLLDANADGDALDVGERAIWLDGLGVPRDISFDVGGTGYVSETISNQIWRLADGNNDGDVVDVGEKILFAEAVSGPQWIVPQADALIIAAYNGGQIHRLADLNGDGDALDVAENVVITPNYQEPIGVMDDGSGGFYFTTIAPDTVYHARDTNGDGDMFDVAEVLSYADPVYGLLNGPFCLTPFDSGGFLLTDFFNNQVKLVRDRNGDGDALDLGDVFLFADGINQPIDIVALPSGLPGDFNHDGTVDAADYVVWRKNDGTQVGFDTWRANFGRTVGSGSFSNAAVPEPSTLAFAAASALSTIGFRRRRRTREISAFRERMPNLCSRLHGAGEDSREAEPPLAGARLTGLASSQRSVCAPGDDRIHCNADRKGRHTHATL